MYAKYLNSSAEGAPTLICRVEASITNHLRHFAPYLENYKEVQFFFM